MPRRKTTTTDTLGRKRPPTRRGFGTVRQTPSGNWQASYVGPDNQRHKAPSTFGTKLDAEAWLAPIQDAIRRDTWKPPTMVQAEQFGKYAEAWLATRRNKRGGELAAKTRADYGYSIRRGMASLHPTRLGDLTPAMIRTWHSERVASGATQAGKEARLLHTILATAVDDGLIPSNPVPPEARRSQTGRTHRPPTEDELARLVEAITPRFRLAVLLAAFGGLRLGEWRALRRSDLTLNDTGHYVINVERQAVRLDGQGWLVTSPKSEAGIRRVALPAWLTDDVTAHLFDHVGRFGNDLLFVPCDERDCGHRKHGDFADSAWRRAWDDARLKVGVAKVVREHDLRHFYGSSLAERGLGIRHLQAAMGQSTAKAALGYLHAARGADTGVADLFEPLRPASASNVQRISKGA